MSEIVFLNKSDRRGTLLTPKENLNSVKMNSDKNHDISIDRR